MRAWLLLLALSACGRIGFDGLSGFGDDGPDPLPKVSVFAGGRSTCSIVDGFVSCWGDDRSGQLGDGLTLPRTKPARIFALDGAISFDISDHHACAVRPDGQVWCWGGDNNHYELGDEDAGRLAPTTTVPLPRAAVQVAVGDYHSCALLEDSEVYCWGKNTLGQLGYGTVVLENRTPVRALIDGVAEIRAGQWTTCARKSNGEVWCWGENYNGQVGIGSSEPGIGVPSKLEGLVATQISVGEAGACALEAGHYRCWGTYRLLGREEVTDGSRPQPPSDLGGLVDISVGTEGACATSEDGSTYCWGNDDYGLVGDGAPFKEQYTPQRVTTGLAHVSVGYGHACAVKGSEIVCWGRGTYGQLGDGRDLGITPTKIGLTGMTEVGVGNSFACARSSAKVYCWGSNSIAQLGNGGGDPSSQPMEIAMPAQVTGLTVGAYHACVATATVGPRCWGANYGGQLGVGDTDYKAGIVAPAIASQLLVAGDSFTCAITAGGAVQCWGANDYGELGDGSYTARTTPTTVGGLGAIVGLTAGGTHACALDGTTSWCWGQNDSGQLGVGDTTGRAIATPITDGPNFAALSAGYYHTCGFSGAGQVYCTGSYLGGESLTPFTLPGVTAKRIASGGSTSCLITTADQVSCAGDNSHGQLGDGTWTTSWDILPVVGLPTVQAIAANDDLACAVTLGTGEVWCWGNNDLGQLGRGTMTSSPSPVPVTF